MEKVYDPTMFFTVIITSVVWFIICALCIGSTRYETEVKCLRGELTMQQEGDGNE